MAGRAGGAAARAAKKAEGGGVEPTERELELQRQLDEARGQLAAMQEAGENPEAPAPESVAIVGALSALVDTLKGMQEAQERRDEEAARREGGTFREFETPGQVERSLRGSVTRGEHSGRHTARPVTFRARGGTGSQFNGVRRARDRYVGPGGEAVVTPGVHYTFTNGEFVTDDAEVVEYLRARPGFNLEFWEVGKEPGQAPSAEPVIDAIIDARVRGDVAALDSIEHEERSEEGYGRQEVFVALESARRSIKAAEARS